MSSPDFHRAVKSRKDILRGDHVLLIIEGRSHPDVYRRISIGRSTPERHPLRFFHHQGELAGLITLIILIIRSSLLNS